MNLMPICVLLVGCGTLVTLGCASPPPFPTSSLTGAILDVKIGESVNPKEIVAKSGDEVRWVNTTNGSVDIFFVKPLDGVVSCQKGFVSAGWGYLFAVESSPPEFIIVTTVHRNESASLCFSTPGTYAYIARMKTAAADRTIRMAGTVKVE
jgi:plastocyanin